MSKTRLRKSNVLSISVLSEGSILPSSVEISSISIFHSINKVPTAKLTLVDGMNVLGDFQLSNSELFVPGKKIEIRAGYNQIDDKIFEGIIIKHQLDISKGSSKLTLEINDPVVQMTKGKKSRYFFNSSDSDIFENLISSYSNLTYNLAQSAIIHPEMVQYSCTDWDFLITRTKAIGKLVRVQNGKVEIFKPKTDSIPVEKLILGTNVITFEAELDAQNQYHGSKGVSWNQGLQNVTEKVAQEPNLDFQGNIRGLELADVMGLGESRIQDGGSRTDEELQAWTDSDLYLRRLSKIRGRLSTKGNPNIKPGDMVSLQGFGDRFSGKAFVTSVFHEISNSNWVTHLELGLDSSLLSQTKEESINLTGSGIIPGIKGLQYGKITAIEQDPEGGYRVKVLLPLINSNEEGVWSRLANMDAGNNRGIVFFPEIGDEVVVGFINEDPRDVVVLGRLFSKANPSPISPSDDNHEKGIFTRSGIKLAFDDENIALKIETPKGNSIYLSEKDGGITIEDENGNCIKTNSRGLDLISSGNLKIQAADDVTIEGVNITLSAQASLKAEGRAGATLESSGTTVVKGSLIQIN
jgi:Rhs element Vgr protein